MQDMKGFMAKSRTGGKISSEYKNNCGHPEGSMREQSPQPKKLLTGKVEGVPMKKPAAIAKASR